MTNVTGTVVAGTVSTTFTGTTTSPVTAGTPFVGTITATAPSPPPPPPATINVGETTILTGADNGNGNLLVAQPITLSSPATLQSLSFYVKTVGGQLRLGLYSGATPTTLIAQTAAFTPVAGWNTQPATSAQLPAGQYWLAYLPQSNTLGFEKANTGGTSYYHTQTFGSMPTTFPGSPSTTPSHWSFYGTFSTAPVVADTTPPSAPTNAVATENPGVAINLSWTASTDNVGVTGYNVFRNGSQIATPTTNSYADTGPLTAGTGYTYTVSAFDAAGNTSMPASFSSTVFPTKNIPGQAPSGGTAPVTHGSQLTINRVGPWTLQGVPQGSETLTVLNTTQLSVRVSTFPGDPMPGYIPSSTYVLNNNPTNHGGIVPAGGMTIDGWFVPAGTWIAQFYDMSAQAIIVQGDCGGAGSPWPGVMFRGCRMRLMLDGGAGWANNNAQITNGITWFNFCDAGGTQLVSAGPGGDPDGGATCGVIYDNENNGGTHDHMYVIRCYLSAAATMAFGRNSGDAFVENYCEGAIGFYAVTPYHINGLANSGGQTCTLWLRNHLSYGTQWDLTNGQSSYVTGGSTGTSFAANPYSNQQTDLIQMAADDGTYPGTGTNLDGSQGYQIRDNYLGGGNFTLQLGVDKANTPADVSHVVVTGNIFTTFWAEHSGVSGLGYKGPSVTTGSSTWNTGTQGNTWSNNTWGDDYGTGTWTYGSGQSGRSIPAGNGPRTGTAVSFTEVAPGP